MLLLNYGRLRRMLPSYRRRDVDGSPVRLYGLKYWCLLGWIYEVGITGGLNGRSLCCYVFV